MIECACFDPNNYNKEGSKEKRAMVDDTRAL
jgi:hypothetical protein